MFSPDNKILKKKNKTHLGCVLLAPSPNSGLSVREKIFEIHVKQNQNSVKLELELTNK